jgi:hypothetical protein
MDEVWDDDEESGMAANSREKTFPKDLEKLEEIHSNVLSLSILI